MRPYAESTYLARTSKPSGDHVDPLSAIFSSLDVQRARVHRVEATAPWGFRSTRGSNVRFVLMLDGAAMLQMDSRAESLSLHSGDLFILFGNSDFSVVDEANSLLVPCETVEHLKVDNTLRFGGGGSETTSVIGRFSLDHFEDQPIFKALPSFLHLQLGKGRSYPFQSVLELISLETVQPGLASQEMIERLCEMLFIHAVRAYVNDQDHGHHGWLAGLSDPKLGKVIELLHAELTKNWTVDSMAASAGMSRSSFAARFKLIVGQSPLEYLTHWRLHRASVLMRRTDLRVAVIARKVGYASESAFTKAFKKFTRATPSEFRR